MVAHRDTSVMNWRTRQRGVGCVTALFVGASLLAPAGTAGHRPPLSQCFDGHDNDNDGWTDWPLDSGCSGPFDNTGETHQCNDGKDNDGDGKTDYPGDPNCSSSSDNNECPGTSTDLGDNDGDGHKNCSDPDDDNDKLADTLEVSLGLSSTLSDTDGDGAPDAPDGAPKVGEPELIIAIRVVEVCHDVTGNDGPTDGWTFDDPYIAAHKDNPLGIVRQNSDPQPGESFLLDVLLHENHQHDRDCLNLANEVKDQLTMPANLGWVNYPNTDQNVPQLTLRSKLALTLKDHDVGVSCAWDPVHDCDEGNADDTYGSITPWTVWRLTELSLANTGTVSASTMASLTAQQILDRGGVSVTLAVTGKIHITLAVGVNFSICNIAKHVAALELPVVYAADLNAKASQLAGVSCV